MQISVVNSVGFQGKINSADDVLASINDKNIRQLAYMEAESKFDRKKHQKITKGLIMAAPLAAGVAAGVLCKGKSKIFSKNLSGVAARIANGLKESALWGTALGSVALVGLAKDKLSKSSSEVRKFDKEHPIASMLLLLGAGIGAISLSGRLATRIGKIDAPDFLKNGTARVAKAINESSVVESVKNFFGRVVNKTPEPLKEFGAMSLAWSPQILLLGGLLHSLGHGASVRNEFAKNYNELKDRQLEVLKARQVELELENDFLKTEMKNREDLDLLNNPTDNLSDEVTEEIESLNDDEED